MLPFPFYADEIDADNFMVCLDGLARRLRRVGRKMKRNDAAPESAAQALMGIHMDLGRLLLWIGDVNDGFDMAVRPLPPEDEPARAGD